MSYADFQALKAVIATVPALTGKTFISKAVVNGAPVLPPYAVIHPNDGRDAAERFTGPRTTTNPRAVIHSVGLTAEQAQAIADLVKSALVVNGFGIALTVAGRVNEKLEYSVPIPVQVDASVTPALLFHVADVSWKSNPA